MIILETYWYVLAINLVANSWDGSSRLNFYKLGNFFVVRIHSERVIAKCLNQELKDDNGDGKTENDAGSGCCAKKIKLRSKKKKRNFVQLFSFSATNTKDRCN